MTWENVAWVLVGFALGVAFSALLWTVATGRLSREVGGR